MKIDLNNKIVLVTGASRGIGKQVAKDLASYGATVVANYPHPKDSAVRNAKDFVLIVE